MKKHFLSIVFIFVSIIVFGQFKETPDTIVGIFRSNSLYPNPPDSASVGCLKIPNGTYIGDEKIAINSYGINFWPGYLKPTDTNKDASGREWFHKVTIVKKDSLIHITKIPFYIQNGKKIYIDSIGGICCYNDIIKKNVVYETFIDGKKQKQTYDSAYIDIHTHLDTGNSKNIAKIHSDGVPLYVDFNFTVRMKGKDLLIDEDYQKGLLFKRIKDEQRSTFK